MLAIQIKLLLLVLAVGAGRRPRWLDGIAPTVILAVPVTSEEAASTAFPVPGARLVFRDEDRFDGPPSSSPRSKQTTKPMPSIALRSLS